MSRYLGMTLLTVAFAMVPATGMAAVEISVSEVVERGAELDGEIISVRGELVGDYGHRDDGWTWTQLNGDVYVDDPLRGGGEPRGSNVGIGVRIPTDMIVPLDPPGGYRERGPVVRVTGVWKYHDPQRQGESYLEVESLVVDEPGRRLSEDVALWPAGAGLILLAAAGMVAWLTSRRKGVG